MFINELIMALTVEKCRYSTMDDEKMGTNRTGFLAIAIDKLFYFQ